MFETTEGTEVHTSWQIIPHESYIYIKNW